MSKCVSVSEPSGGGAVVEAAAEVVGGSRGDRARVIRPAAAAPKAWPTARHSSRRTAGPARRLVEE